MRPGLLLCCCLLLLPLNLLAEDDSRDQVYKTEDAQGRPVYSDRPGNNNGKEERVKLPPVNAMPAEDVPRQRRPNRQQEQQAVNYSVRIVSPGNDSSVPPGQRDLTVSVNLEPALKQNHSLIFYMDDERLEQTRNPSLTIEEIFRGSHTLEVEVVDEQGQVLGASEPVVVHVHRPTVNSPARR